MLGIIEGADVTLVENQTTLAKVLRTIAKLTATEMLAQTGGIKPYMSKAEAYRKYGRGVVDKWISEGYLSLSQDEIGSSSKMRINRSEIEALAEADDLLQFQINRTNEERRNKKPNHTKASRVA